jgi:hypothetical protein
MNIDSNDSNSSRQRKSTACARMASESSQRSLATGSFTASPVLHRQNIERIFIAIGLLGDTDERHCRQALHDADFILGGQVERLAQ